MTTLLGTANTMHAAGIAVVPLATDGTKRPAVDWKAYQHEAPGSVQLQKWFARPPAEGGYDGLGVLTGPVSGNLELLELEGRAVADGTWTRFEQAARDHNLGELFDRLKSGWLELSPTGGIHLLYRVDGPPEAMRGNTKLARRPGQTPGTVDVLIETRGAGGFCVTAPSNGRSHPTGKPWTLVAGGPTAVPTITVDERDALYLLAGMFDQMPAAQAAEPRRTTATPGTSTRPGDDYNARTTWDDILIPRGWTKGRGVGGAQAWIRPGKNARDGISATTGRNDADNLYVFTTSTEFDTETPYDKFGAYALLEHGGDITAAARQLRADGYGTPDDVPVLSLVPAITEVPRDSFPTDGANALAPSPAAAPATTVRDSEDAHAHRLIGAYGELIRYCPERGLWLVWNGSRWTWQPKGGGQVREYAKTIARRLTDADAALTQRRRALSANGISGCLRQAETDDRITVAMHQLDADPWTLNTPGGHVDLRTGQLHPPDPAALCTKTTRVTPTFEETTIWDRFLDDTFADNHDLRDYVQRLVGVTLIGKVLEQLLAFPFGLGANGKSTLVETIMFALGIGEDGYAIAVPAEMLMIRKHSEHPAELAQLAGARMVVASELDDGQKFAEARIKQLTGRDSINARFLYGQPFTFPPSHTMWLVGNHRPQARTGGLAFWRRVKLLLFAHVVPVEQRDPALGDKLEAVAGAVLAWAIRGCLDYLTDGIREPAAVTAAVESYAADQDTIGRFVEDHCHRASSGVVRIRKSELRDAYVAWCREVGEEPASARRFGTELKDRFDVAEAKSNGREFYVGITVLKDADDEDEKGPWRP